MVGLLGDLFLLLRGKLNIWREGPRPVAILIFQTILVNAVEIGHQAEEVVLGDRIVFVIVASGATDCHAQHGRSVSAHAIHGVFNQPFFGNRTTLVVDPVIAVEGSGDLLIQGGIGKEVSGQLLGEELVVGHVFVEGVNHPVAPWPARANHLVVEGVAVAVARNVEPVDRHALAVVGRGQSPIDHVFVGFVRGVGEVGVDVLGGWRQAEEVHVHAADKRFLIGLGRGCDALGLEFGEDEIVDRRARPGFVFHLRHRRFYRSDE